MFSTDVNAVELDGNKIKNWVKQKTATIKNCTQYKGMVDKVAHKNEPVGWTIGKYLNGRYRAKNGKTFSENSLSLEIIGVDILFINPKKTTQKTPFDFGLQQIDEGGVGRILSHGKNGFIIVSANRSNIYSTNKDCDLTQYYKQWCNENGQDYTNKKTQVEWLKNRNKNADLELKKDLKK